MTDYKEKLWIQRLSKGYSRKKLGQMIGKYGDSIRDWETGRFAPSNFLDYIRWCRALDMDPMDTVGENDNTCSICRCEFDIDSEGGIEGYLGIIPTRFCPTCFSGLDDLFTQIHGCHDESL